MKKILFTLLLSGCMLMGLSACGAQPAEEAPQLSTDSVTEDALHEITQQEMIEASGLDLPAPAGATDVTYHVLRASEACPIAEMEFTLDGQTAYLRAQSTGFIPEELGADASLDALNNSMDTANWDISGLYFEPEGLFSCDVAGFRPALCWTGEGYGVLAWVDVAPGVLYNLCSTEGLNGDALQALAETVFVPLQGEADGEAEPAAE